MPIAPSEKAQKNSDQLQPFAKAVKKADSKSSSLEERALLYDHSPTTQDLIDAIQNNYTILIEDTTLKHGMSGFEAPIGEFALSLTTLTAYIIDIIAVLDHFLLHKTVLHPVLCEQILTSTHEVVTNAILWSNLEVDCPNNREKSLNFCDLIKDRLKNTILARRLLKLNFHVNPESVDVVIISSGKGFDWHNAVSKISSDFQGLAIINTFADEVVVQDQGKVLRLRFFT
ncbi:MAG: ATP-binding protein [Alphaproteobacteria bacterium]|jgi:hypothetical protein|nr:ATP-binding protein [Alphaproteobacteria bacterium]